MSHPEISREPSAVMPSAGGATGCIRFHTGRSGLVCGAAWGSLQALTLGWRRSRGNGDVRGDDRVERRAVPWLWAREGIVPTTFVVVGGVVYLVGAAGFAKRWPTLRPAVFSYHEVWHIFTLVAALAQFVAIWMLAT